MQERSQSVLYVGMYVWVYVPVCSARQAVRLPPDDVT